uniref:Aconitate hydratase n=1 Tax=Heterorhabditis bacteriophora TaxID=37862 RepID=A0A1I7X8V5_HETBA
MPYQSLLKDLKIDGATYKYYDLTALNDDRYDKLPISIRYLLEAAVRHCDEFHVLKADVEAILNWEHTQHIQAEIPFKPARVILQDFTGVPAVVDLASMRDAVEKMGADPGKINPVCPVDLVIDHSVQVDHYGNLDALAKNQVMEFERNKERFNFLKWGSKAFNNLLIVPPGSGIVHQVNLEYLARTVFADRPISMVSFNFVVKLTSLIVASVIPEVIGYELVGHLSDIVTSTDIVLTITKRTIAYLGQTGRDAIYCNRVEQYLSATRLLVNYSDPNFRPIFSKVLRLDLGTIVPCVSGPKRPNDRVNLSSLHTDFANGLGAKVSFKGFGLTADEIKNEVTITNKGRTSTLSHGSVVIAAITSCTNTSNPSVMLAAGLVAKKYYASIYSCLQAVDLGLTVQPYVKTSLSPGSGVVTKYLQASGLLSYLEKLGFNIVGYGCMTCIGNSGPLDDAVSKAIEENNLIVAGLEEHFVKPQFFKEVYANIGKGSQQWQELECPEVDLYPWDRNSTYIKRVPFFEDMKVDLPTCSSISNAYCLLNLGDSVTTDHISPAGSISRVCYVLLYINARERERLQ